MLTGIGTQVVVENQDPVFSQKSEREDGVLKDVSAFVRAIDVHEIV